jgi:hypothetical protein
MDLRTDTDGRTILLTLQNKSKPDQIVYLMVDRETGIFETQGLRDLFGMQEIRLGGEAILPGLPEYAQVLSFLFDTMSTAQDLNLPYHYQEEFTFEDTRYMLYQEGDHRVLKRMVDAKPPIL